MNKLSSEQMQQVLEAVPGTLRKLVGERDYWKKEAQSRMRRDDAEKVAHAMHEKGISVDVSIDDLVTQLEKAAEAGKLGKIAEAVEMVGPDMGQKIAHLSEGEASYAVGGDDLTRFCLGGVG